MSRVPTLVSARARLTEGIKVLVADGDPSSRNQIRELITTFPDFHIIGEETTSTAAISSVRALEPDLLIVDIEIPDGGGFNLLREFDETQLPTVIFTAPYEKHALRAFETRALGYLLKPVSPDHLQRALARVRDRIEQVRFNRIREHLIPATAMQPSLRSADRLIIRTKKKILFLRYDEIESIEAAGNYVKVQLGRESYRLRGSIGSVESKLDPTRFVRIHRSVIVNIEHVKELQPCNTGEYQVTLHSGKQLTLSRHYRNRLEQFLQTLRLA